MDWTKELFEKNPELFLKEFENRLSQSKQEVANLLKIIEDEGFRKRRILDLNCGIGRHTLELAKKDIEVVGTDLSPDYIEIAKEKAEEQELNNDKIKFKVSDMRKIKSNLADTPLFDGIICLWTSFGFYDNKTNKKVIRQCLELVNEEGFFILEVINRDWLIRNFEETGFSKDGKRILLEERSLNLENSRVNNTWTWLERENKRWKKEKEIEVNHRVWSLHELIQLFENSGWNYKSSYSGLQEKPIQNNNLRKSRNLLIVAEK